MAATIMTKDNFIENVMNGVSLVDFWATWCGPCQVQLPIVDDLASELKDKAMIGKINVDEQSDLASHYGIMSVPTLILFKDGKPIEKMVGVQSKDSLKAKIMSLL